VSSATAMRRIALIVAVLLLAVPATAIASGDDVIEDCADDGELSRTYSQAEYKKALQDLPADLDEYTDCRATIRRARLRGAQGKQNSAPATGPKRKISKHKRDKIKRRLDSGLASAGPLRIGDSLVKPGSLHSSSTIPTPLIVVLVLAALGAAGAGTIAARRFVITRRNR
jgi:hypothetical protein